MDFQRETKPSQVHGPLEGAILGCSNLDLVFGARGISVYLYVELISFFPCFSVAGSAL